MKKIPIEELIEQASEGPFSVGEYGGIYHAGKDKGAVCACEFSDHTKRPNAEYNEYLIAHALNMMPKLLEALHKTLGMIESEQHPFDIERFITKAIEEASFVEVES